MTKLTTIPSYVALLLIAEGDVCASDLWDESDDDESESEGDEGDDEFEGAGDESDDEGDDGEGDDESAGDDGEGDDDPVIYEYIETVETNEVAPNTDALGLWAYLIFQHQGRYYRFRFTQGNAYWRSRMGQWEDPLELEDGAVACEQVESVREPVMQSIWKPVA